MRPAAATAGASARRGQTSKSVRLATRSSPLARYQAELVARRLRAVAPGTEVSLVLVETVGDRRSEVPIHAFDERGIFVVEVERAVIDGRADVAVHSAKDLPSGAPPEGLVLASVPERADPRDALVGSTLDGLGEGSTVATGSVRRRAQLAAARPDLRFRELRGNIATRLERVPAGGAVVVAAAALDRLGLAARAAEVLDVATMLPQVGQGAIALRCRAGDGATRQLLALVDDEVAHACVLAERAFLASVGGGCDAPVGAHARRLGDGPELELELDALVARPDGRVVVRQRGVGDEPEALGSELGRAILAAGGAGLLAPPTG